MGTKEDMNAFIQAILSTNEQNNYQKIDDNELINDSTFFSDSIFDEIERPKLIKETELNDSLLGRNTIGFNTDIKIDSIINNTYINNKPILKRSQSYDSFFKNLIEYTPIIKKNKCKNKKDIKEIKRNQNKILESIKNINKMLLHLNERIDSIDVCVNKSFYAI